MATKGTKNSFAGKLPHSRDLLHTIHSDLCGPFSTPTKGGSKYFLTFTDDHSRKVWVFFLKAKSEAFAAFTKWKAQVETYSGKKIKI